MNHRPRETSFRAVKLSARPFARVGHIARGVGPTQVEAVNDCLIRPPLPKIGANRHSDSVQRLAALHANTNTDRKT